MRWRTTTQLPVPLQYHHHERPKGSTVQQASPFETCADVNEPNVDVAFKMPMSMNQVRCRI